MLTVRLSKDCSASRMPQMSSLLVSESGCSSLVFFRRPATMTQLIATWLWGVLSFLLFLSFPAVREPAWRSLFLCHDGSLATLVFFLDGFRQRYADIAAITKLVTKIRSGRLLSVGCRARSRYYSFVCSFQTGRLCLRPRRRTSLLFVAAGDRVCWMFV